DPAAGGDAAGGDASARPGGSRVQALLDGRGVLAWLPWEGDQPGGRGAVRFVNEKWVPLTPENGWQERLVHLVPLLDGSVLQIGLADDDQVKLTMTPLDAPRLDEE